MNSATPWRRLSTGDLMTLWAQTSATPMNVALLGLMTPSVLAGGNGRLRLSAAREAVAARLHRVPELRQRIWRTRFGQGKPLWADDGAFDVAHHVATVHLPRTSWQQLLSWAATAAAEPLDLARPPWRLVFVTGLPGNHVGVMLVLHHVLADGATAVRLASALFDSATDATPTAAAWRPTRAPDGLALMRDVFSHRLRALMRFGRQRSASLRRDIRSAATALGQRAAPLGLPVLDSRDRQLVAWQWPLEAIRAAGHRYHGTVNDVMLAIAAAGVRGLAERRGLSPGQLTLRVSVPVGAAPGSRNAGGTLPIVISISLSESDPVRLLDQIVSQTRAAKAARDRSYDGPAHSPLMPLFLVRLGIWWLRRYGASRINLYLTNITGPTEPLWFNGSRVHTAIPIAPLSAGVPMACAVASYDGTVTLSINAGPQLDLAPFSQAAAYAAKVLTGGDPAPPPPDRPHGMDRAHS